MAKSKAHSGLAYRKADLHVHTPASSCYKDRGATPERIIARAMEEGLSAIAITDHNTGSWVDKVVEAAKGKIAVFPGVEVSCTGGKNGSIHVICVFDAWSGERSHPFRK